MKSQALERTGEMFPSVFSEYFKPWEELFESQGFRKAMTVPAVNVSETADIYKVSMAAPGLKKSDFKINLEGNTLTINAETQEEKEEHNERFTRKEYNFSSFSRSFLLPEAVDREKIDAQYENGVLKIMLPKTEASKKVNGKTIIVR